MMLNIFPRRTRAAACYVSAFLGGSGVVGAFTTTTSSTTTRSFGTSSSSYCIRTTHNQVFSFVERQQRRSRSLFPKAPKSVAIGRSNFSPPLYMSWLQNFFGGGAYSLTIDYETLEFPGNELGRLATTEKSESISSSVPSHSPSQPHLQLATFAGGCFWGLELALQRLPGVMYTAAGYSQGMESNPSYEQVCAGNTGHTESICVYYDPKECSYEFLLDAFLDRVDPTTVDGQGRDFGRHYRTGIYYHSQEQKILAHARMAQEQSKYNTQRPLATECRAAKTFWPAEAYHQQYLAKGGRFGTVQSPEKGCTDEIRCYG